MSDGEMTGNPAARASATDICIPSGLNAGWRSRIKRSL